MWIVYEGQEEVSQHETKEEAENHAENLKDAYKKMYIILNMNQKNKGEKTKMNKKAYEKIDAKITTKDGKTKYYNVLEMMVKSKKEDLWKTEDELISMFHECVTEEKIESWNPAKIELKYTWGNKTILTTTIER